MGIVGILEGIFNDKKWGQNQQHVGISARIAPNTSRYQ
jgi:hypothetical protein